MNKTIWLPLALGIVAGLLAGVSTVTNLSFLVPGTDTESAIGFFVTLFLLAAAFGGPVAGAVAPAIWVTISAWYGPPEIQTVVTIPEIFWTNLVVLGVLMAVVGYLYSIIFERVKMPLRILYWAGLVIAFYLLNSPLVIASQYFLLGGVDVLPAIMFNYRIYIPQMVFDIFFTSLVFLALPTRYRRPLWYAPQQSTVKKS